MQKTVKSTNVTHTNTFSVILTFHLTCRRYVYGYAISTHFQVVFRSFLCVLFLALFLFVSVFLNMFALLSFESKILNDEKQNIQHTHTHLHDVNFGAFLAFILKFHKFWWFIEFLIIFFCKNLQCFLRLLFGIFSDMEHE